MPYDIFYTVGDEGDEEYVADKGAEGDEEASWGGADGAEGDEVAEGADGTDVAAIYILSYG